MANLDVHGQLQAALFAAEPLLLSPSNIDIDHRGRVWVCEIVNYRGHQDKRPEGDRILILEDTDGDGRADSQKVFYQGRDIDSPHGICVLGNRVIVSAASKVLAFTDVDGDDRPDTKEELFTGIDGVQHDHGIHAFVFGPDGKLYFNFGNAGQQLRDAAGNPVVDTAGNVVRADRNPYQEGMVFRCNLDGGQVETLGWNFRNNWMIAVDSFGTLWQSDNDDDGNRGVRINYVMEFGNYGYRDEVTGAGWRTPRTGMEPQLPQQHWHQNDPGVIPNLLHTGAGSPTGITVYEGDLLPQVFRGQILHCDAGPSVTRAYVTADDGAGYRAEIVNILEGTRDPWFRPSDVKVAPDGSLIVADWYDPGVGGHRMEDLDRGRLFRVMPKGHRGRYEIPKFDFETTSGAIAALQNPNNAVRYLAWAALHKMGSQAEPALLKLWNSDQPHHRARALWLLGKIDGRGAYYVDAAVGDNDPRIRIQSLRLARQLRDVDVTSVVERLVDDSSPQVRRECAIALRHNHAPEAAQLWARLAAHHDGQDRWYLEALGIAADKQWDAYLGAWLQRVGDGWNTPAGRDILWRSRATVTPKYLSKIIQDPDVSTMDLPRYFRALDFLEGEAKDQAVSEIAFGVGNGDPIRSTMISTEAVRRLRADDVSSDPSYRQVLEQALRLLAGSREFVELVAKFDASSHYPDLLNIARQDHDGQVGVEAMRTLLAKDQTPLLGKVLWGEDVEMAQQTIVALGNSAENLAADLLRRLVTDDDRPIELRREAIRALAKIRTGASWLWRRAESDRFDDQLRPAVAAALTRVPWNDIRENALELFPLPPSKGDQQLPPMRELVGLRGDAARGKVIFATTGTCAKCHIVNGQGKEVGPQLSEIGSKLSREAMFESVLYPSAGISHNYETYALVTKDGNIVTGLLQSETDKEVAITSEDGIARVFERSSIDQLTKQAVSLMPADLQKLMTQQELIDVIEYLETLKTAANAREELRDHSTIPLQSNNQ